MKGNEMENEKRNQKISHEKYQQQQRVLSRAINHIGRSCRSFILGLDGRMVVIKKIPGFFSFFFQNEKSLLLCYDCEMRNFLNIFNIHTLSAFTHV